MKKTEGLFCEHAAGRMRESIEFAAHMILNKVEEFDYTPEEALRATVARMGIAFFAERARVPEADVLTFVNDGRALASEELRSYLNFFDLGSLVDACELKHVNRREAVGIVANLVNIGHRYSVDNSLNAGSAAVGFTGIAANVGMWSK